MIFDIIQSGFSPQILIQAFAIIFALMISFPVHEAAHAFVSNKLGDPTAKNLGRITLNPLKHLDPIGTLMIFLVGFGWGKPVPIISRNLKNVKRDMALISLAGPLSNVVLAFIFLLLSNCIFIFTVSSGIDFGENAIAVLQVFYLFFNVTANLNITLAIFNLIPIPPFDGSRLLSAFLPTSLYYKLMEFQRYSMIIVLVLVWSGVLNGPLRFLSGLLFDGLSYLANLPFSFF